MHGPREGANLPGRWREGLTLVELLVSVTLTLLLILAVVQAFDLMGNTISDGRAKMELATRVRRAADILQDDLDLCTSPIDPAIDPDAGAGYFEYQEGPRRDRDFAPPANSAGPASRSDLGDFDDVLMATVSSRSAPFRGRGPGGTTIESTMAEVVWWVAFLDVDGDQVLDLPTAASMTHDVPMLMRRVLLIRPEVSISQQDQASYFHTNRQRPFFKVNDLSAHVRFVNSVPKMVPNSLSDLASRQNRFAHVSYDADSTRTPPFPSHIVQATTRPVTFAADNSSLGSTVRNPAIAAWSFLPRILSVDDVSEFASDWIVLSDLLAFDIRAYDPQAPIYRHTGTGLAIAPGDYGFLAAIAQGWPIIGRGDYVDLGLPGGTTYALSLLLGNAAAPCPNPTSNPAWDPNAVCYDTWSRYYERDGVDQDEDGTVDEGTNELDDDNDGLIDEPDEQETQPPYNVPLRGLEVRIRGIDVPTRQVRQTSVVGDFTK